MLACLHPVHFSKHISKKAEPVPVRINNQNLVLWRGPSNDISCFPDSCSHRGAQLSKGRVKKGILQCSYHGWQFDATGKCVSVPQAASGQYIPKACSIKPWKVFEKAGVVWVAPPGPVLEHGTHTNPNAKASAIFERIGEFSSDNAFVTDYVLNAEYSYELQIENLLDPAHIHFVHNGFQGNEDKAGFIRAKEIAVDYERMTISGVFEHTARDDVPKIKIVFHWPSVVDVSIYNKVGEVVRKNIIYVAPSTDNTCRVLFRDVAFKKYLAPPFVRMLLGSPSIEETYQVVNNEVVDAIMQQDIRILESQQANAPLPRYLLLTESDRLIVEYRRVCRKWAAAMRSRKQVA